MWTVYGIALPPSAAWVYARETRHDGAKRDYVDKFGGPAIGSNDILDNATACMVVVYETYGPVRWVPLCI